MKQLNYVNLHGDTIPLSGLDAEERKLVVRLRRKAANGLNWSEFRNYALNTVAEFYDQRGVSRKVSSRSPAFQIALDLAGRLGIAEGKIRTPGQSAKVAKPAKRTG